MKNYFPSFSSHLHVGTCFQLHSRPCKGYDILFYGCIVYHGVHILHFLYPIHCWWILRWIPWLCCCWLTLLLSWVFKKYFSLMLSVLLLRSLMPIWFFLLINKTYFCYPGGPDNSFYFLLTLKPNNFCGISFKVNHSE